MERQAGKQEYGLGQTDIPAPQLSGQGGIRLVYRFVKEIFPMVDSRLDKWKSICRESEDEVLGIQALASISAKRFHALGGSVYALYPKVNAEKAVRFIVSLQTISDYLDNLCDRVGIEDEAAFRQLHVSMLDAVDPEREMGDYYSLYPYSRDNGYLKALVEDCREQLINLPSYSLVLDNIKKYVQLYADLQSYKHLPRTVREERLKSWCGCYSRLYPGISCWEFSAAAGSTLGIFALFASAFDPMLTAEEVEMLDSAYFPWICGLHILLDYYIDATEDMETGDLNFTSYYESLKRCEERLCYFMERSLECCSGLPYPGFHRTVVNGLIAMYLSDPKASMGLNRLASRNILKNSSPAAVRYYKICRFLRTAGMLH